MKFLRWFQTYTAHRDQRTALANLVSLLIVSNQPFYPLYVYWLVGTPAWVTFVSFVSTPFFFAVPAIARRSPLAGRVLVCMAGTLNTAICVWVIGDASGVAMFYFACILIGVLLFRGSEWIAMALCTGLPMVAFWFLRNIGTPLHVFSAQEYASLVTLHAVSVGSLIAFVGYKFSSAIAAERS